MSWDKAVRIRVIVATFLMYTVASIISPVFMRMALLVSVSMMSFPVMVSFGMIVSLWLIIAVTDVQAMPQL